MKSLVGVDRNIGGLIGTVDTPPVANLHGMVPVSKLLWQWPPLLWCDPHAQQMPLPLFFLHQYMLVRFSVSNAVYIAEVVLRGKEGVVQRVGSQGNVQWLDTICRNLLRCWQT